MQTFLLIPPSITSKKVMSFVPCLEVFYVRAEPGNPAHNGEVADVDDHAGGSAVDCMGGKESQDLRLKRVVAGALRAPV